MKEKQGGSKRPQLTPKSTASQNGSVNSAARKRGLLQPYHSLAEAVFSLEGADEIERELLAAARDGDVVKMEAVLDRRHQVAFSLEVRDAATGDTALLWAAKRGHNTIVDLLLDHGADVTLRNHEGQTAVEVASPQLRQRLLGAVDRGGVQHNLLQAAWQGRPDMVARILDGTTVDIDCRNSDSLTPLLLATRDLQLFERLGSKVTQSYQPVEVVETLLENRARLNLRDEEGKTALHYVSQTRAEGALTVAELLLESGCDTDVQDRRCFTPVHCASQSGAVPVLKALLVAGCDPNARGSGGATPLHISAINGHDQVARVLLSHDADVTLTDDGGLTPVDMAKTKKVKVTLREAWTEATQGVSTAATSGGTRTSVSADVKKPKKKGEVIFDGAPRRSQTWDSIPHQLILQAQALQAPDSAAVRKSGRNSLLDLSNAETARRSDTSPTRADNRSAPHSPLTGRRLAPLKASVPARMPAQRKELKFSPGTKEHDGTGGRVASAKRPVHKSPSDPGSVWSQQQIPVTVLGLNLDDNLQDVRSRRTAPGPSGQALPMRGMITHNRQHSDPYSPSPAPSDYSVRCASKASIITANEDWDDLPTSHISHRHLVPPADTWRPQHGLDLARMQLTGYRRTPIMGDAGLSSYPNSRKILPPTPNPSSRNELRGSQESNSSKDSSPRSGDDEGLDDVIVAIGTAPSTALRPGVFHIEQSRVRSSNDSGLPDERSATDSGSSKSSSVSSSSSLSVSSPAVSTDPAPAVPQSHRQSSNVRQGSKKQSASTKSKGGHSTTSAGVTNVRVTAPKDGNTTAKLQAAAKDNASTASLETQSGTELSGGRPVVPPRPSIKEKTVVKAPVKGTTSEVKMSARDSKTHTVVTSAKSVPSTTPSVNSPTPNRADSSSMPKQTSPHTSQQPTSTSKISKTSSVRPTSDNTVSSTTPSSTSTNSNNSKASCVSTSKVTSATSSAAGSSKAVSDASAVKPLGGSQPIRTRSSSMDYSPSIRSSSTDRGKSNKRAPAAKIISRQSSVDSSTPRPATPKQPPPRPPPPKVMIRPPSVASSVDQVQGGTKSGQATKSMSVSIPKPVPSAGSKPVMSARSSQAKNTAKSTDFSKATRNQTTNKTTPQSQVQGKDSDSVHNASTGKATDKSSVRQIQARQSPSTHVKKTPTHAQNNNQDKKSNSPATSEQVIKQSNNKASTSKKVSNAPKPAQCPQSSKPSGPVKNSVCDSSQIVEADKIILHDLTQAEHVSHEPIKKPVHRKLSNESVAIKDMPRKLSTDSTDEKKERRSSIERHSHHDGSHDGGPIPVESSAMRGHARVPSDGGLSMMPVTSRSLMNGSPSSNNSPSATPTAMVKQIVVQPLAAVVSPVEEHTGPVIQDPFESLRMHREEAAEQQELQAAAKLKSRPTRSARAKQPAIKKVVKPDSRQASANKKTSKSKDRKGSNVANSTAWGEEGKVRMKTPKKGKGKKKKSGVDEECGQETVMMVVDKSDDESGWGDESYLMPQMGLRNTQDMERSGMAKSNRLSLDYSSLLPGQMYGDDSESSEDEDDDCELVDDAVVFMHDQVSDQEEENVFLVPQTVQAIDNFSRSVTHTELDELLDGEPYHPSSTRGSLRLSQPVVKQNKSAGVKSHEAQRASQCTKQPEKTENTANLPNRKVKNTTKKPASQMTTSPSTGKGAGRQSETSNSTTVFSFNASGNPPSPDEKAQDSNNNKKAVRSTQSKRDSPTQGDVDDIIEEILKTTPNPSMTLSLTSQHSMKGVPRKSMTRDDFVKELRRSQDRTFREVSRAEEQAPRKMVILPDTHSLASTLPGSMAWDDDTLKESALTGGPLPTPSDGSPVLHGDGTAQGDGTARDPPVSSRTDKPVPMTKPPVAPKPDVAEITKTPERSPRFVRKHDSMREQKPQVTDKANKARHDGFDPASFVSDFSSISIPSLVDSLVPENRAEMVTSRLGRGSAAGARAESVAPSTDSEGEIIQWKRGQILGKGAYGTVWCGLVNSGELIAVKQLELNTANMDRAEAEYEKIQQEVELLKTLKHKNIVGYLGTSLEDNVVSIFMEFVPGGSLANVLGRFGSLEEEVYCHYTHQILEGIDYLHANNVIHRDIKGGNVMLMHNGEIKLIDFGCAKRVCMTMGAHGGMDASGNQRLLKSMRGTPYWMAPEVVREEGHGTKSDIWSIGCTVFEMATRKPPWADMAPMAAIFSIGNNEKPVPELPEKASVEARRFVAACLTRDPFVRPSARTLLQHPFMLTRRKKQGTFVS